MLDRTQLRLYADKHNQMEREVTLMNLNYFLLQNLGYELFFYNSVVGIINHTRHLTINCSPLFDSQQRGTQALIVGLNTVCSHM
jgi:hypothetical protein